MTTTTPTPEDDFAAAFAEINAAGPAGAPATPPNPTPPAGPTGATAPEASPAGPTGATAPATPPAGPTGATAPEASPAGPTGATAPATPPAGPDAAALQAEIDRLKAQLAAPPAAAPAPAPAAAPAPTPAPPIYTAAEEAAIAEYVKEWPDVAAGEALMRRKEYAQLVGYVFDQLRPVLDNLHQVTERTAGSTQYRELVALVPDYDSVRDKVLAWIDTQPDYLKAAYHTVTDDGSPEDVADLITRWRKETGAPPAPAPAPAAAPAAAAPAAAPAAALPAAVAAAAASLKPVTDSRAAQPVAADPNDFDSAFKEFAQMK